MKPSYKTIREELIQQNYQPSRTVFADSAYGRVEVQVFGIGSEEMNLTARYIATSNKGASAYFGQLQNALEFIGIY